jgi:hypothetical protein
MCLGGAGCRVCNMDSCYGRFVLEFSRFLQAYVNLLKPTGYVMHQQFNTQKLYALPTLYLCVFLFV